MKPSLRMRLGPPHIYEDKITGFKFYGKHKEWTSIFFYNGRSSVNLPTKIFVTEVMPELRKRGIIEANTIEELS